MQCSVVRWKDDTGGMATETAQRVIAAWMDCKRCSAESDRSMSELEEMQCSVVRWKDDTGGMTTETAQRVVAAWMEWKRCSAVSCDGSMIQEA